MDPASIHLRCGARLGVGLLFAPKQLRHYHCADDLSRYEWSLTDKGVELIDVEDAAAPQKADKLERMTSNEMAADGYYVVAAVDHNEYKQHWKFLTLWDDYGLYEAAWDPMSVFIQPNATMNHTFPSYLVKNNESQLPTSAETLSKR